MDTACPPRLDSRLGRTSNRAQRGRSDDDIGFTAPSRPRRCADGPGLVRVSTHGHTHRFRPAPGRPGHRRAVLRAECEEAITPDQLAILRCIAEAAVAAERETGCPAEISASQCIVESDGLMIAPGNKRDEETLLYAMGSEAANVHLGSKRQIADILKDLGRRKSNWLRSAARDMAKAIEGDWKRYKDS